MVMMYGRRKEERYRHAPSARTVWRRAFGAAPCDGRVESQERVDTLDRKVGAKRESFPWRGPTEIRRLPSAVTAMGKEVKKKTEKYWRSV
jgi:hypothetical protein